MRLLRGGLRVRSARAFALLALVLSAVLSISTYQLTRSYLLDQRESLAVGQATVNASVAKGLLASGDTDPVGAVASVAATAGSRAVIRVGDRWYASVVELNETKIPPAMVELAAAGIASHQRVEVNGNPYLVVGADLPGIDAGYFEFIPLREYQRTLETLLIVLVVAASVTTIGGALAGWLASRRVLRPLAHVSDVAKAMSEGDLDSRVAVADDPDLEPVAASFNEMADSLQQRIDREIRFTADVSHELRTPLTAMGAAVNLAQRAEMSERAEFAIGIVAEQTEQLRRLTLELLEISRFDAGVAELQLEDTDVIELSKYVLAAAEESPELLRSELGDDVRHSVDRVRFERILANLVENAARYAGGVTQVTLSWDGSASADGQRHLLVVVDDAGPGVPESERVAVFGRFHRGTVQKLPGAPKGTGLGLALVEEHAALHGGSVRVTDSPNGGARFVVELP